jgi:hypothetical protein
MKVINTTKLNLVAGGLATSEWYTKVNNTMENAIVNPVVNFKPASMSSFVNYMLMFDNSQGICTLPCKVESPKNGDRNALGQQYSWGI